MPDNKDLLVYHQNDMQKVMDYLNVLVVKGVVEARKLASIATILESGKPLEGYLKQKKGSDVRGDTEQDEQGSNGAV